MTATHYHHFNIHNTPYTTISFGQSTWSRTDDDTLAGAIDTLAKDTGITSSNCTFNDEGTTAVHTDERYITIITRDEQLVAEMHAAYKTMANIFKMGCK
jgi:hypothetical protein